MARLSVQVLDERPAWNLLYQMAYMCGSDGTYNEDMAGTLWQQWPYEIEGFDVVIGYT